MFRGWVADDLSTYLSGIEQKSFGGYRAKWEIVTDLDVDGH